MIDNLADPPLSSLLTRIAAQDERALRELYELTSSRLFAAGLRIVRSQDHAEDVLQETFLYIWRNADRYQLALSPPMAWLGLD